MNRLEDIFYRFSSNPYQQAINHAIESRLGNYQKLRREIGEDIDDAFPQIRGSSSVKEAIALGSAPGSNYAMKHLSSRVLLNQIISTLDFDCLAGELKQEIADKFRIPPDVIAAARFEFDVRGVAPDSPMNVITLLRNAILRHYDTDEKAQEFLRGVSKAEFYTDTSPEHARIEMMEYFDYLVSEKVVENLVRSAQQAVADGLITSEFEQSMSEITKHNLDGKAAEHALFMAEQIGRIEKEKKPEKIIIASVGCGSGEFFSKWVEHLLELRPDLRDKIVLMGLDKYVSLADENSQIIPVPIRDPEANYNEIIAEELRRQGIDEKKAAVVIEERFAQHHESSSLLGYFDKCRGADAICLLEQLSTPEQRNNIFQMAADYGFDLVANIGVSPGWASHFLADAGNFRVLYPLEPLVSSMMPSGYTPLQPHNCRPKAVFALHDSDRVHLPALSQLACIWPMPKLQMARQL